MARDDGTQRLDEDQERTWVEPAASASAAAEGDARDVRDDRGDAGAAPPQVGRLRLEREIGRGGMGTVWAAYDEVLDRRVAVKAIRRSRRLDPRARLRFLREARILSQLDHPGICRLFDLIEDDGHQYLLLEFIEGTTLDQLDLPTLEDKLRLARRVAEALAAAHAAGVAHLDLKPGNVMATADGRVKILDFGIARSLRRAEAAQAEQGPKAAGRGGGEARDDADESMAPRALGAVGTISHMSPEQACQEAVGPKSDLYSFGILLQELLTGRPAYAPTQGFASQLVAVAHADTVPPEGLPKDLTELLRSLLERDPEARPDAAEVVRRLDHLLDAPARRRRRLGSAAAVVLAAFALWGVFSWARSLPEPSLLSPEGDARVVVLPFVDAGAAADEGREASWIELGLPDLVSASLERLDGVEVVDSRLTQSVLGSRRPADLDDAALQDLARRFSADFVLAAEVDEAAGSLTYTIARRDGRLSRRQVLDADATRAAEALVHRLERRLDPDPARTSQSSQESGAAPLGTAATAGLLYSRFAEDPFVNRVFALGSALLQRGETAASVAFFEVCLELAPSFDLARLRLASALHRSRGPEEARPVVEELVERARASGDDLLLGDALRQRAWIRAWFDRDYAGGERDLVEVLEISRRRGGVAEGRALRAMASVVAFAGRYDESERFLEEAEKIARRLEARGLLQGIYFERGIQRSDAGRLEEASRWFAKALETARELGAEDEVARTVNSLGVVADERGLLPESRAHFLEAAAIHRRLGNRHSLALSLSNAGGIALRLGDLQVSEAELLESLALSRETSYDRGYDELCSHLLLATLALERPLEVVGERSAECAGHLDPRVDHLTAAWAADAQGRSREKDERLAALEELSRQEAWDAGAETVALFDKLVERLR